MGKFKIGDLVIGNKKNTYGITARGAVCKVVQVDSFNGEHMGVVVADTTRGGEVTALGSEIYWVTAECFDMYKSAPAHETINRVAPIIKSATINEDKKKVTLVFDKNDYTISSCTENDEFDPAIGVALALAYKCFGSKTKFHKWVNAQMQKNSKKKSKSTIHN